MNYLKLIIPLLIISYYACDPLTNEYKDISYFTPKLLPDGQTIIVLKNIHKYSETGTPGGITSKEKSSKWYFISYDINTGSVSEANISGFGFEPFWIKKGITCATDSLISFVNAFNTYFLNISNSELTMLPEEMDIIDLNIDLNNQNLFLLEGFHSYSIKSFNKNTNSISELITLDNYYANMASSYLANPGFFILWKNHTDSQYVAIVDINTDTTKTYLEDIKFADMYDYNKVAILNSDNTIQLKSFTADTLVHESSISLNANNVKDFSINQGAEYIVYHATDLDHGGYIILKDVSTQSERILFSSQHKEL